MLRWTSIAFLPLAGLAVLVLGPSCAAFTPAEGKMPMTVMLVRSDAASCGADCPEWLSLTGRIGFETTGRLAAALARLGRRRVPILLDSPGGESLAALAMGRMIRARGLDTAVAATTLAPCDSGDAACRAHARAGAGAGHLGPAPGVTFAPVCASACVLVLAGGVDRDVPPGAFVGVHQAKRVLTYHPVMNTFRVLSRTVNGRKVEVSRTLVSTRALPVRVVTQAAPQSIYDAFERTLIGLGVDESIVPLMRATPPSGIHWLTAAELASTRISTDTTEAGTLVERAAAPPAPKTGAMALAAAKLGEGGAARGIVDWRVSPAAGSPALVATVDVPERHLHAQIALRRDTAPGGAGGFVATVDLGPPAAAEPGRTWAAEAPRLCDASGCLSYPPLAAEADDGKGRRQFRVRAAFGDGFLSALLDRGWILVPLSAEDGAEGWITLSVKEGARAVIAPWERLCCGRPVEGAPAVAPPPVGEAPVMSWAARAGDAPLHGTADLRSAGLRLVLEAVPAPRGAVLTLDAQADTERFGPLTALEVGPVRGADGLTALTGAARRERPGRFAIDLVVRAPVPPGTGLGLTLVDGRGRRLTVSLPLPEPFTEMLRARPRA